MIELSPTREVALVVGNFPVRWYALVYVLAFWLTRLLLPYLARFRSLELPGYEWTRITAWGALGALTGGRLGYILFYEPGFYLQNPQDVLALWMGGMSFHGGLIGSILLVYFALKRWNCSFLKMLDALAPLAAAGLALGRIGNFLNQELFSGQGALWAAAANGVIALVCLVVFMRYQHLSAGRVAGLLAVLYSLQRFVFEVWRIDGWVGAFGLTRGQLLTVPVLLVGLWLLVRKSEQHQGLTSSTIS